MSRLDAIGLRAMSRGNALILFRDGWRPVIAWCGRADSFWWTSIVLRQPVIDRSPITELSISVVVSV